MNQVEIDKRKYHLIGEMIAWLKENVGPGGWSPVLDETWRIESAFGNTKFIFADPQHATLFTLKWL